MITKKCVSITTDTRILFMLKTTSFWLKQTPQPLYHNTNALAEHFHKIQHKETVHSVKQHCLVLSRALKPSLTVGSVWTLKWHMKINDHKKKTDRWAEKLKVSHQAKTLKSVMIRNDKIKTECSHIHYLKYFTKESLKWALQCPFYQWSNRFKGISLTITKATGPICGKARTSILTSQSFP